MCLLLCFAIISKCYVFEVGDFRDSQNFFAKLDSFLIDAVQDDDEKLTDLKKVFFADNDRKLYISVPLNILQQIIEKFGPNKNWKQRDELWHRLIDNFFHWICSSDKNLKLELEEKFWYYFHTESHKLIPKPF